MLSSSLSFVHLGHYLFQRLHVQRLEVFMPHDIENKAKSRSSRLKLLHSASFQTLLTVERVYDFLGKKRLQMAEEL